MKMLNSKISKGLMLGTTILLCGLSINIEPAFSQSSSGPRCSADVYEAVGRSSAAFAGARERRAKRRAIRKWVRAVEDRLLGGRGDLPPALGTDYSNFDNAQIISFNCSGRPLTCVLRARPCRD